MNQDPTLKQSVAITTYSFEQGICAFNEEAEIIFRNYLGMQLQLGNYFLKGFDNNDRYDFETKLKLCRTGQPQKLLIKSEGKLLNITISPILGANNCIEKASILFDLSEEDISRFVPSDDNPDHDSEYSKQIFSNLFYNNPDAVFSFDLDGNFVNANKRSVELAETSLPNLLRMHFLPFIPEDNHEKVTGHFRQALQGNHQRYITRFQSTKGTLRWLEISNLPITRRGEIVGVYGIAKDITEKKFTEKKILEERQMLRAIIDNIPDYIFVKDRNHKSILSNRKFYQQILGKYHDDSAYGFTPVDYFDSDKGEKIIADNEWVMTSGKAVVNRPDTVINIHGHEEKVLLTKVPLKNQKEEIIGLVGIARDITATYLHNKKQEIVFKAIKAFGDNPTFQNAMIKVLKIFCVELGYDYAESYKVSVNNQKLVRAAFWPKDHDLAQESTIYEKGVGLPGMVWQSGKPVVLRKDTDGGLLHGMQLGKTGEIGSAVGFPILFQGKLVSIFCLGSIEENKKVETEFLDDITLQIASAIERKRSQEQLNDFFEYSPNLIAVIGLDGFIKKINPSFTEKFGYSENEILIKPFIDFIHPSDLSKTYEAIENVSVGGSDFEIKCLKKNGEYLWISWRFSRFFAEENVVFVYGTDITPLKKVHEELSENIKVRKVVQNKLEESEKKYRSLFDASPLPMWVLDSSSLKFLKVNKAAMELYGYSEDEFSKMTVKDLWVSGEEKRIQSIIAANKEKFSQLKIKHLKKNGQEIYVNVNSNPVEFDGRRAQVSLIKNVTDRIKAEEKLLQREQRFKALVQDGSDLISIVDSNFNYTYNSPASKAIFGMDPSELRGLNFKDFIHKDDFKNLGDYLSKLDSKKRVQLPSYRVKGPDDKWRWIETIATNLKNESAIEGIVLNSRDITEFVEQEKVLIDSLRRYDIVAKATSDVITDFNIEKNELRISESVSEMFGYEEGNYSPEWWNKKVHPEDVKEVAAAEGKMKNDGLQNLTIEYRFKCADGSYKHVLDRSYLIFDENRKPVRIIGSMQDITEQKRHLIAIENNNRRLKEIAWTQSHLVRAPLAKVMGLVDLLLNYKEDLEDTDELLHNILNSANELDGIIRKIAIQTEKEL